MPWTRMALPDDFDEDENDEDEEPEEEDEDEEDEDEDEEGTWYVSTELSTSLDFSRVKSL